jgi:hypothetical protein
MGTALTFPQEHKPRFHDFELVALVDETVREGGERCLFAAHPW